MATRSTAIREPFLREMLSQPIVRLVMLRDGVSPRDIIGIVDKARCQRSSGVDVRERPDDRFTRGDSGWKR